MSPRKDAEHLAKHLARHGAASTGGDALSQFSAPGPADGQWVFGLASGAGVVGMIFGMVAGLGVWPAVGVGIVLGLGVMALAFRGLSAIRRRAAADAAEARAIREAETERQIAEMKARGN